MWAFNTFHKWIIARNNNQLVTEKLLMPLEFATTEDINRFLSFFVCEVRKVNGSLYPAKTILSLVMGIQGYLRSKGILIDILNSTEYEKLRSVLDVEMKRITEQGVGIDRKQSDIFTAEMEDKLWTKKLLGDHNPRVLVRTIMFLNGKNFALRGGAEHRRLRFKPSQISLHEAEGTAYLKYVEDVSKCNPGVKHYANTGCPERCHVRLYKKYLSLSPVEGRNGAFYLQPLKQVTETLLFSKNP